jgi:phosphate starvation-inducible protein PhoH and related proteins
MSRKVVTRGPSETPPRDVLKLSLNFDRPDLLHQLFGEFDKNLIALEDRLGVYIAARGNKLSVEGEAEASACARDVLVALYARIEQGQSVDMMDVDAAVSHAQRASVSRRNFTPSENETARLFTDGETPVEIRTRRKTIQPRSPTQITYMHALAKSDIVFALGPAGTGKTYLAVAQAISALVSGQVDRIILSRPAVEAGERLGFLPGDMKEKVDPYLRPLYDALYDMLPAEQVERRIASGEIEIAPLAFMRGRTLADAFVILDEAQNTTTAQMKMFLTRFGQRSRMVICGDPHQVDLPPSQKSGLVDAVAKLEGIAGISFLRFDPSEVVRHPLVGKIVVAYGDGAGERKLSAQDIAAAREPSVRETAGRAAPGQETPAP